MMKNILYIPLFCRFLILCEYFIKQFNHFASNGRNIKLETLNNYHENICLKKNKSEILKDLPLAILRGY